MNTGVRIAAFAAALAATFGAAYGVGATVGPFDAPAKTPVVDERTGHEGGGHADREGAAGM
ncbi:hypothetical protein GCM10010497_10170 [Streptomyces cinereoruber]|uniref:DUF2613 family protein n=1 Tax=Streptomyces cinereoruber TaxID=67260 RepID=A0AAV4KHI7_9ACTN|nr:hypothetical protein [Streptomyces cinereoruber]MBB4156798.1 hypothetical protein [Streptomyces cinereoruber]MBY8815375.1 hypothetical protein [Streptomyces cinereoruber]NIH60104.1 hypothetical protein [Streptomyces cinereoruber]QEV34071.1 hypothetical protein CP977_19465 [Streptomyces cinereoruber]GGR10060.1 hypothetical protein GCM10010497_10170 [Streptomyces cinereoruber]